MRTTKLLIPAILAPLFIMAGCLNYEQSTKLNSDSSGEMEIHYWTSEDNVQWMSNENFSFHEGEIKDRYKGSGVDIQNVSVETDPGDSTRHVRVSIRFQDINKLSETAAFKNTSFSFVKEGDLLVFNQTIKGNNNADGMGMSEYTFKYSYTFPGDAVSSNASNAEGRTLIWEYKLPELAKDVTLTATVEAGAAFDFTFILIAAGGVAMIIVVLFLARKRKKQNSDA